MSRTIENPYAALKGIFHEPSRMAIMTALCAAEFGMSFNELKTQCALTDGNLNRHLKTLTEAGAVRVIKKNDHTRTRTTAHITNNGRLQFVDYLRTLEDALRQTAWLLANEESIEKSSMLWQGATPAKQGGFF